MDNPVPRDTPGQPRDTVGQPWSAPRRRHNRMLRRILLWATALTLPATIAVLWLLSGLQFWPQAEDLMGLLAISVGILGVFFFFMLLYRAQSGADCTRRHRWLLLVLHAGLVLVLLLGTIWLGYDSPWRSGPLWGSYDLLAAAKPWIISVLVIGSITLLGGVMDIMRKRLEERWRAEEGRESDVH
ncbi:MAG: hypothetical protein RBU27_05755 [Bacteroidota bacterium]|nr:hypothetical protein [Bacteroidota bacterium]